MRSTRSKMPLTWAWALALALAGLGALGLQTLDASPTGPPKRPLQPLDPPKMFESIEDETERSIAYFLEAGKVIVHPRCVNCHPAGDRPLQGELGEPHQPPVLRGEDDLGVVGMRCSTCHTAENYDAGGVPGEVHWALAPIEMAWEGSSLGAICRQLKDPERNGDRTLAEIATHMKEDPLVGWGWDPGVGREPVPGDQETFGQLVQAWIDTGAACPD